jgi:hypothetical protein
VVEVELFDAEAIHLLVALFDQALAFTSQSLEIARRYDLLEHEEALVTKLTNVLGRDMGKGDGHVALLCSLTTDRR